MQLPMESADKYDGEQNPDSINVAPVDQPSLEQVLQPQILSAEQQAHTFKYTPRNVLYHLLMLLSCSYHA
jgi:hypothetical protein